jgi:hypothetical protein
VGVALSLYSSARLRFIIHQDVSPMRLFLFPLFFFFFFDRNLLFLFLISTWYFLFAPFSFLFFSLADFFLIHLLTAHIQRREDYYGQIFRPHAHHPPTDSSPQSIPRI